MLPAVRSAVLSACVILSVAFPVRAEELRDPFVFGSRTESSQEVGHTLVGVLWDAKAPLAMIGEETVGVGELIGTWRIVNITEDGVTVERDGQRQFVTPGSVIPSD